MVAFLRVFPERVAAWDAGSSRPPYASVSTINPDTGRPATVEVNTAPNNARATSTTELRKKPGGQA